VFRCFAEACRGLNVQLVISHGGALNPQEAAAMPGDPLVVCYAPQLEVLAKAQLTITHAGLNTVLDSLANAVPLVTVPITYEQPAIARRVEWTGSGRSISLSRLDSRLLKEIVSDVLQQRHYRHAALQISNSIRNAGGVARAADIVEAAVGTAAA
jgi:MGT family glycosyltransferase